MKIIIDTEKKSNKPSRLSLREKILVGIALCALIPFVIGGIIYIIVWIVYGGI